GDVLVMEHQDRATIHPRLDRPDLVARRGRPQIDTRYLADENGVDLANRDRHQTDSRDAQTRFYAQFAGRANADAANLSCPPTDRGSGAAPDAAGELSARSAAQRHHVCL